MCSCGGSVPKCNSTCCSDSPQKRNVFDMISDPCAHRNWQNCKAQIYGKGSDCSATCSQCTPLPPCCRFPPKRCPPPPLPPSRTCDIHRCNPPRPCGFIVKPSNFPSGPPQCCPGGDPGMSIGSFNESCCPPTAGGNPCSVSVICGRPPKCCPVPDPCNSCCANAICCRPQWKHPPIKLSPYCSSPPPLPPRSFRYKNWLSQFPGKVDTNICASRYSGRVDRCGCNVVIVEPPACDECSVCPCHPCA